MSRIEDDREAARQAERLVIQKREQEQRAKASVAADSAFSKLVGKQKGEQEQLRDSKGRSAVAAALQAEKREAALTPRTPEAGARDTAQREQRREGARTDGRSVDERARRGGEGCAGTHEGGDAEVCRGEARNVQSVGLVECQGEEEVKSAETGGGCPAKAQA